MSANRYGIRTDALKVGDVVWFKLDVEQCSPILEIRRSNNWNRDLAFVVNVTAGEYVRGHQEIFADDIFGIR